MIVGHMVGYLLRKYTAAQSATEQDARIPDIQLAMPRLPLAGPLASFRITLT